MKPKYFKHQIDRDRKTKSMTLSHTDYIDKILEKFEFQNLHPQRSPMINNQDAFRQFRDRKEFTNKVL